MKSQLIFASAALALALSACSDPAADAKAEAEAIAKAKAAEHASLIKGRVSHSVDCLSGLKWQSAALAKAGVGPVKIYTDHFHKQLETTLAAENVPAEAGKPALTPTTIDAYLAAVYPDEVKTKLEAGVDANKDGTIGKTERSGYALVAGCIQEVAEMGEGPLKGPDKVGRMFKMREVQNLLQTKGA